MAKSKKLHTISTSFMTGAIATLSVVALILATGMLFIQPQLSLMIYAFSGMALLAGNHLSEQKKWSLLTDKRIIGLQRRQDTLSAQMEKSLERVSSLKAQVSKISILVKSAPVVKTSPVEETTDVSPPLNEIFLKEMRDKVSKATSLAPKPAVKPDVAPSPKAKTVPETHKISAPSVANDRKTGKSFHDTLSDIVVKELVQEAIKENDIEMFVQPILQLSNKSTKFFEVFGRVRAREGSYIRASRYLRFARHDGVVSQIDHQLLMHCLMRVKASQDVEHAPAFFINVEPRSLKDPGFMNILLEFLAKNRLLANRLVIEMPQDLFEGRDHNTSKILSGLKALGCSFSMDHVQHLHLNLNDLHKSKVRFVKIRAGMMLQATQSPRTSNNMLRVKRLLESNGIEVIVEKVESEKMLESLERFDLHYGQGYLFGRPNISQKYNLKKVA